MTYLNPATRILSIEMSFDLPSSFSLKDKRRMRQRLIDRLKNKFNISIIESAKQDDYRSLELSAAYVAIDESTAKIMEERIHDFVLAQTESEAELREFYVEIL